MLTLAVVVFELGKLCSYLNLWGKNAFVYMQLFDGWFDWFLAL